MNSVKRSTNEKETLKQLATKLCGRLTVCFCVWIKIKTTSGMEIVIA